MGVSIKNGAHEMDEFDVTRFPIDAIARDHVPSRMSIVTFTPFADLDCGFHFKAGRFTALCCIRID